MQMSKEEFLRRLKEDKNYAPGWDAITNEFARLYPGIQEDHYGTELHARAIFGGDNFLDGYSIYRNPNGHFHIVTYGMSELYVNEEAFGGEYSGWGYEMTIRLKEKTVEHCLWAIDMLSNLARYTYETQRYLQANDYIIGNGSPLHIGEDSLITSLMVVRDVSAQTQDTVYGKVEFLQLVGITWTEAMAIQADYGNLKRLIDRMRQDNPELVTDMKRTKSYF